MKAAISNLPASQYLTFLVAGEEYAIQVLKVREVIKYAPVTRMPMAPACIKGVLNVRGEVVPVIELSVKLGLGSLPTTQWTSLIIVEVTQDDETTLLSFMVDSVRQVFERAPEQIMPPPRFGTPVHVDYLKGMLEESGRFVLVLDIDRILSTEELRSAISMSEAGSLQKAQEAVP